MFGYIRYGDGSAKPATARSQIAGGGFLVGSVSRSRRQDSFFARRRADRTAQQMQRCGICQAVFPVEFPYTELFAQRGIRPVDTLPLRQALAVPLVQRQLTGLGLDSTRAVIAVCGDRMSRALMDTTRALALRYRYVMLSVPGGEEDFARTLRREYGVSLLLRPSAEQVDRADALILFAPGRHDGEMHPVLHTLYHGGENQPGQVSLPLPAAVAAELEPGYSREQMAAALYAMGVLTLDSILAEIPVDRTGK